MESGYHESNLIEARVLKKKTVHVIIDNYATHKHPAHSCRVEGSRPWSEPRSHRAIAREPFDRRKVALAKGQISTSPQLFKLSRKTTATAKIRLTHCIRPGSEQRVSSSNNRGFAPFFGTCVA
jgi:hypothetical protein